MMFTVVYQQAPTVPEFPWSVVIALIGALISVMTLGAQWKKDVNKQRSEEKATMLTASDTLFDQYQEELQKCREDRVGFRNERSSWEKERDDLIQKVKTLEIERSNLSLQVAELQLSNKKLQSEIYDLNKRLTAVLEDS